jgi:hypothetical protein
MANVATERRIAMPNKLTFGLITLTERGDDFLNGYQVGLLYYQLDDAPRFLTDADVYEAVASIFSNIQGSARYRAGVMAGWFAGLYTQTVRHGCTLPTLASRPVSPNASAPLIEQ